MRKCFHAVLLCVIVLLFGGIGYALFMVPDRGQRVLLIIAFSVTLLFCLAFLIDSMRRKDKVPDHFKADWKVRPFECKGLSFLPVFAEDGSARLDIYVQNRFSRPCRGRIYFNPPVRSFRASRVPVPKIEVPFEVTGAEYGVIHVPYDTPVKYQGKQLVFDIAAKVSYPRRRGRVLRYRRGHRVSSPQGFTSGLISVLAVFVGIISISSPAKAALIMPSRPVREGDPGEITYDPLWLPAEEDSGAGAEGSVWADAA